MKKQTNKLPIDELNNLTSYINKVVGGTRKVETVEIIDSVEDLLITAFVFGVDSINADLQTELPVDTDMMNRILNKEIEGKVWTERVADYLQNGGSSAEINRVVDTEMMRVYNETKYEYAKESGMDLQKTWVTMLDDKVRDTHSVLEGVSVALDDKFYTFDDSAYYPGGFNNADNNVNCRCVLSYSQK